MTLQQLEYFLAAAGHRSFSAAAQALHMAQPSLSEQIRRLEAELGSPLFVRGRRGLELTEAGRLLQPHAERTLAAAQEAGDSVREVRELARRHRDLRHLRQRALLPALRPRAGLPHALPQRARRLDRPELLGGRRRGPRRPPRGRPDRAADRRPRPRHPARDRRRAALPLGGPRARARADDDRAPRRGAADPLRRALRLGRTPRAASSPSAPSARA